MGQLNKTDKRSNTIIIKNKRLTGNSERDVKIVNEAAGLLETPEEFEWHHVEDGKNMQLVPAKLHRAIPHTGGREKIKELNEG